MKTFSRFAESRKYLAETMPSWRRDWFEREWKSRAGIWAEILEGRHVDSFEPALDAIVQPEATLDAIASVGLQYGLRMLGPVGTGKTHCGLALAREYIFQGKSVRLISAVDVAKADPDELADPRFLLVDDLGTEPDTPSMDAKWFQLFDRRWETSRPTIISSNLDPVAFEERLGGRILDRLDGKTIVFAGPSRRRERIEYPDCVDEDGRALSDLIPDRLLQRVENCTDEEWQRWCALMITEGFFEQLAGRDFIEAAPAAFVAIVREVFGNEFDDDLYIDDAPTLAPRTTNVCSPESV